ncbi:MAG: hypothetical protein U0457_16640 [Candidatus Sericytochromatia bacterium]
MEKLKYLNYIEDTKKHHKKLGDIAELATSEAFLNAKQNNIEISYLKGDFVIKETPSGEIIKTNIKLDKRRKVKVGSKIELP